MTDRPPRAVTPGKPSRIDTGTAHSARIYNYWLGGKDNFPADREAAEAAIAANPGIVADVRANRAFLARVVRYLVAEAGVRQFLDIGTGLPTADNTHEVAQRLAPGSRVVYVDNDPIVLAHARALLTSTPEGDDRLPRRGPDRTGADPQGRGTHAGLQPAGRADAADHPAPDPGPGRAGQDRGPADECAAGWQLPGAGPSGQRHPAEAAMAEMTGRVNQRMRDAKATMRTRAEITGFFDGLELIEPGVVQPQQWRPEPEAAAPADVTAWCGVACKPAEGEKP